jgi:predicted DNA-binding transcriptional regulator AlpA
MAAPYYERFTARRIRKSDYGFLSKWKAFLTASFFPTPWARTTMDAGSSGCTDWDRRIFTMAELPKVVSAKVAARFVGLSESTHAKLRLNGNGPVYCNLGRRVVYRTVDLEQWLQSRTARDTSDADARFLKALTVAHPR